MKGWKKTAAAMSIVLFAGAVLSAPDTRMAVAASSTQQKIDQAEQDKKDLEDKRDENQEDLNDLKGEQNSLKRELNKLNDQLLAVVENLESLEAQIRDKEEEILAAQAALEEARATEKWQYECMVARIRQMYERQEDDYISALLSSGGLSDILNRADYFERIAAYERMKMDEFKATRALIEEQEKRLQNEKVELDNLKVDAEAERNKVSGLISQTANSIAGYADQISEAEQKAREYEEEIRKQEENLEYLRKKLAEEIAMSQAAANAAWRDISEVSFEESDRYLLANLIYCEAGGEPYAGQLAVGSVVINRVLSSKYPDSVVGVIYQNKQFSPVGSGRLALALSENRATESCYKAADEAMSGITNVGNCVYFRTPIEGLTGISIGGHIFY